MNLNLGYVPFQLLVKQIFGFDTHLCELEIERRQHLIYPCEHEARSPVNEKISASDISNCQASSVLY